MPIGFEYTKYKPTTKKVWTPQTETYFKGPKFTTVTVPAPDPVRIQKKTTYAELLRGGRNGLIVGRSDLNSSVRDEGVIDRSSFFQAGKYPTYNGLPAYYESKVHELPSREQFVSEGGLFGEPVVSGNEIVGEEGLFGDQKEAFDWESLDWKTILLLVGGLILLFIIVAVF